MRRIKKRLMRIIILCVIFGGITNWNLTPNIPKYGNAEKIISEAVDYSLPVLNDFIDKFKNAILEEECILPVQANECSKIPIYNGNSCTVINDNIPFFTQEELSEQSFEYYSELDKLGRCQTAYANICPELMPTEERGEIGHIKPSGWHTVKYNGLVEGNYLYNRCHLIGFQLTGENDNERNLFTGTRWLNTEGMLPYENLIAEYVRTTQNHVLYRVTPMYEGNNLLCSGVLMEAYSVEDNGRGVCFCVFAHNIQPGVVIDYMSGESHLE